MSKHDVSSQLRKHVADIIFWLWKKEKEEIQNNIERLFFPLGLTRTKEVDMMRRAGNTLEYWMKSSVSK